MRVLITGAGRAIGRATAEALRDRGHEVVATARRPEILDGLDVAQTLALDVTDDAKKVLVSQGFEPALGARPLKRAILRQIQNPLAESILEGGDLSAGTIRVDVEGEDFQFKRV